MSKTLVCGDLHTKYHIFERVKKKAKDFDKVVFLGDYVDDWGAAPEASYNLLNSLIEWKKAEPEKVVLLWGNHDLSEGLSSIFRCSGYNERTHMLVRDLYERNMDLFQIAYWEGNILFTHAGLTNGWCKEVGIRRWQTAEEYACQLNLKFYIDKDMDIRSPFCEVPKLMCVGFGRGGIEAPSVVWADKGELEEDAVRGVVQVVGHTPVKTLEIDIEDGKNGLVFCDTHSTYCNGVMIGDGKLLSIETVDNPEEGEYNGTNEKKGVRCVSYQRFEVLEL